MKFMITVNQDEDGSYIVECPSIPGCIRISTNFSQLLEGRMRTEDE